MVGPTNQEIQNRSSAKFYEYNNIFGKGWSPGYELMLGKNTLTIPTLKK